MTPEEIELNKKRKVLDRLKDRLADSEEEMTDLRAELEQFEAKYKMQVARFYAELDEIEAEIAEEELKLVPDDEEIKKKVRGIAPTCRRISRRSRNRRKLFVQMATNRRSEKGVSQSWHESFIPIWLWTRTKKNGGTF